MESRRVGKVLFLVLGEFRMRRILVALAVVAVAIVSSSNASAGLFHRKSDCCTPAPAACAPAPVCAPAPTCEPACAPAKRVGLLARLHALKASKCSAAPASCCEPAPAPCAPACEPAPAPCAPACEPAPTCCEAAPACGTKRVGLLARLHARKASRCAAPAASCCEAAPAPAPVSDCGCN